MCAAQEMRAHRLHMRGCSLPFSEACRLFPEMTTDGFHCGTCNVTAVGLVGMRGVDQKLIIENGCASINSKEVVLETECATYSHKDDCENIFSK